MEEADLSGYIPGWRTIDWTMLIHPVSACVRNSSPFLLLGSRCTRTGRSRSDNPSSIRLSCKHRRPAHPHYSCLQYCLGSRSLRTRKAYHPNKSDRIRLNCPMCSGDSVSPIDATHPSGRLHSFAPFSRPEPPVIIPIEWPSVY